MQSQQLNSLNAILSEAMIEPVALKRSREHPASFHTVQRITHRALRTKRLVLLLAHLLIFARLTTNLSQPRKELA